MKQNATKKLLHNSRPTPKLLAQIGSNSSAINYLPAYLRHLQWFMGSFIEIHNKKVNSRTQKLQPYKQISQKHPCTTTL